MELNYQSFIPFGQHVISNAIEQILYVGRPCIYKPNNYEQNPLTNCSILAKTQDESMLYSVFVSI